MLFCVIVLLTCCFPFPVPVCAEPPKRIVSLAPNMTEILFALGLGEHVIGVTGFCDYPEAARKKQQVGGMSNPSLERVVALEPDIVVMTTDGNPKEFRDRLHALGIRTYVSEARRLSELPRAVRELGGALNAQAPAYALADRIESSISRIITGRQGHGSLSLLKKKVLFIIWPEPLIVAGPGTIMDDAITILGSRNIASEAKSAYPKYSIEQIIHQAPEVIIIGKGHTRMQEVSAPLLGRLRSVPAVRNSKVFYVSDSLYRLGPRVTEGIAEIADILE